MSSAVPTVPATPEPFPATPERSPATPAPTASEPVQSPPPAQRPPAPEPDPRARLIELARQLSGRRDRALLNQYLQLRRSR